MTTSPYSLDLRKKVIEFLSSGNSHRLAAKVFGLSKTTINIWHVRYKQEGNYAPKKRIGAKSKLNLNEFIGYVVSNTNATAEEIGKHFGISASGARYWLKKLNFSYKKNLCLLGSKRRRANKISRNHTRYSKGKSCIY